MSNKGSWTILLFRKYQFLSEGNISRKGFSILMLWIDKNVHPCNVELNQNVLLGQSDFISWTWRDTYSNKFRSSGQYIISRKCYDTKNTKIFNLIFIGLCSIRLHSSLHRIILSIPLVRTLFLWVQEQGIQTNHSIDTFCNRFTTPNTCLHLCLVLTHSFERQVYRLHWWKLVLYLLQKPLPIWPCICYHCWFWTLSLPDSLHQIWPLGEEWDWRKNIALHYSTWWTRTCFCLRGAFCTEWLWSNHYWLVHTGPTASDVTTSRWLRAKSTKSIYLRILAQCWCCSWFHWNLYDSFRNQYLHLFLSSYIHTRQ